MVIMIDIIFIVERQVMREGDGFIIICILATDNEQSVATETECWPRLALP